VEPANSIRRHEQRETAPRLRVLVVDDDAASREVVADTVRALGYACATAADGAEALELQGEQPADVILSDWLMDHVSGTELCRRTRETEQDRYSYFVFVTALADKAHFLEAMRAGADDYLTKPVDLDELAARLRAAERMVVANRALRERNAALLRESQTFFLASRVDALTGLGNRVALEDALKTIGSHAARYGRRYCAALCDVDRFKDFNDRSCRPSRGPWPPPCAWATRRSATAVKSSSSSSTSRPSRPRAPRWIASAWRSKAFESPRIRAAS
jgi:two-component system, cell cycle response regulator